ncbi:DUF222 domain-containing protein [Glutamicibacter uratoxydans]|uniref:HNH endonuclease signature motif containing protein n=1 Tax=Glutamicibacter uratoxydans TaxID=43667 RepID=UPI003D6E080C
MGIKEVFQSEDDFSRLPLMPDGTRKFMGDAGRIWAGHAELEMLTRSIEAKWEEITDLDVPGWAGPALARIRSINQLRSMLDALEAVTLADGLELAIRGPLVHEVENFADDVIQVPAGSTLPQFLEERWQVSPTDHDLVRSNYITEVAVASRITTAKARQRLTTALGLRDLCPDTFDELSKGNITSKAAATIVSRAQDLQPEQIAELEQQLLPVARRGADDQVMDKSRRIRQKLLPENVNERREKAEETRQITCRPEPNGMSKIEWLLTAEDAQSVMSTVDAHAKAHFADDERSMSQLRSDIMRDALIDGWPAKPGPGHRVKLIVTIPAVELLTDHGKGLAELEGHGPIPMGVALKLAAKAPTFARVLTDPWDGAPMDVGRKRYRPSQALRDFVGLRDGYCTFPGCRRESRTSEVDHIEDWAQGGETSRKNTRELCRQHQLFKHLLGWQSVHRSDGSILWTSPNGVVSESLPRSVATGLCASTDMSRLEHGPQQPQIKLTADVRRVLALGDYGPKPKVQWFTPAADQKVVIGSALQQLDTG